MDLGSPEKPISLNENNIKSWCTKYLSNVKRSKCMALKTQQMQTDLKKYRENYDKIFLTSEERFKLKKINIKQNVLSNLKIILNTGKRMKNKPKIYLFTYADQNYYHFVLPFLFSALKNTDADIGIMVEDTKSFYDLYGKKIANIENTFDKLISDRFVIFQSDMKNIIPHTQRFLRVFPQDGDKYEKAIKNNLEGMERNNTCFFNFVRENQLKLSGIHFVDNNKYYLKLQEFLAIFKKDHENFERDINTLGDEGFLYSFILEAFGKPEELTKDNERILPGDHISPNRNKTYGCIKKELLKDEQWKKAFKQFDKKFIDLMS